MTELPLLGRSVHRPTSKSIPRIETRWKGQKSPVYVLRNSHLEEYAIFKTFNKEYFFNNLLPEKAISYRYEKEKSVNGSELQKLINNLLQEVEQNKKRYTDFDILRKRDFNRKKKSGLLILKCKHHPFVVKVFIENPETFVMHKSKGLVPGFFFYMAGGINRHLLGFTRVKNLENIQEKISKDPLWSKHVTLPRKWFFLPKQSRWIDINGFNIGAKNKQHIVIPGTYCVVSDFVDAKRRASVFRREDRRICMRLCNYLDLVIDPHIDNFLIERNTGKIAIVDTEHFLSVVGMKKKKKFTGYFSWGLHLAMKCAKEMFFKNKLERRLAQLQESETELRY